MQSQFAQTSTGPKRKLRARPDTNDADVRPRPAPYAAEPQPLSLPIRLVLRRHSIGIADCFAVGSTLGLLLMAFGTVRDVLVPVPTITLAVALYHFVGGSGHNHTRFVRSTLDEFPAILTLAGLASLLVVVIHPGLKDHEIGGLRAVGVFAALTVGVTAGRLVARVIAARLIGPDRCLVIGTLTEARRIERLLSANGAGVRIVGALTPSQLGLDTSIEEMQEALTTVAADFHADRLIVSGSRHDEKDMAYVIKVAKLSGLELSVCSPLLDVSAASARVHHVGGMAMVAADPAPKGGPAVWISRGVDIAVSVLLLVLTAPLFGLIALAIRLDSPGPIFFRQVRVGRHGAPFEILKFRSMVSDAEARKAELRDRSEVGVEMFKLANDPRVTKVGRFLRKTSLDELPQLLNVLRKDMTLVGPRPLVAEEDAFVGGTGRGRLKRAPGMTGSWQVMRERVAQAEMLEIDYNYVTNWSLWGDLKILARTALHVMRRGNV